MTLGYDEDMGFASMLRTMDGAETLKLDVGRSSSFVPRMSIDAEPLNSKWSVSSSKDGPFVLQVRDPLVLKFTFAWENKYYVHDGSFRKSILTFGRLSSA